MGKQDFDMPMMLSQGMLADAKLYYDREDYLMNKRFINNYLEIGVLAGDYSDLVIKHLNPVRVDLLDNYDQPDWNSQNSPRFTQDTNYEYVKNKYSSMSNVNVIQHRFEPDLESINAEYDYIYIDAGHSEKFMTEAMEFSSKHTVVGGIIGINDYMIFDHFSDEYYGIVQVVNKFLDENKNWRIVAYVLGAAMHPDIYIKRIN